MLQVVERAICVAVLALGLALTLSTTAHASVADLSGEWAPSGSEAFRIVVADDGTGTHTAGSAGCFDGSVSAFWRSVVETSPGTYAAERLLGNVCGAGWVATQLRLSGDGQTLSELISTGARVTYGRTTSLLVGLWHAPEPETDFMVQVLPNGQAEHTAGDAECWDATPGPFWRNLTRTSATTWHGERRLGNVCNDRWVTEEIALSPLGGVLTEQISTGAVRYLVRDAPSLADDWHDTVVTTFKVRFNIDGSGDHTEGAGECWDESSGLMWRNIVPIAPNVWQSDRRLGNYCNDRWVTARIVMASDGSSFTEHISTGAVRSYVRD